MFNTYVVPSLRSLVGDHDLQAKIYRTTGLGESQVEKIVGNRLLAIPGLELGYCARMGEVDVRLIGPGSVDAAQLIENERILHRYDRGEGPEDVHRWTLKANKETLAVQSPVREDFGEPVTDVPGASLVFLEETLPTE
jgi:nicotinamide-nucleotide amidase